MSNKFTYCSMVITALFWSGTFITGKMAGEVFPPVALTFLRFLLALPLIFLLLRIKEPNNLFPSKKQIIPLFALGTIGTLGYHIFFFLALRHTTAVNASLIAATNPMFTTLFAVLFFRERFQLSRIIGVTLSLFGVFSILTGLDLEVIKHLRFNLGDLSMLTAVFCFSIYALLSRKYMSIYKMSPIMTTAYTFLVCTGWSFIMMLLLDFSWSLLLVTNKAIWFEIFYMSLFASVIGYMLQLNSIKQIGAPKTAMFFNLVPLFAIIQAVIFLEEAFTFFKLFCTGILIFGVYLAARPENQNDSSQIGMNRRETWGK